MLKERERETCIHIYIYIYTHINDESRIFAILGAP